MSKLTPEVQERILKYVQLCSFPETACAAAGISVTTYRRWLEKGAKGKQPYKAFKLAVEKAAAEAEIKLVGIAAQASQENYKAAIDLLTRRFRERWGTTDAEAVKDINRLIDCIAEVVPMKTYLEILRLWDNRSTIGD